MPTRFSRSFGAAPGPAVCRALHTVQRFVGVVGGRGRRVDSPSVRTHGAATLEARRRAAKPRAAHGAADEARDAPSVMRRRSRGDARRGASGHRIGRARGGLGGRRGRETPERDRDAPRKGLLRVVGPWSSTRWRSTGPRGGAAPSMGSTCVTLARRSSKTVRRPRGHAPGAAAWTGSALCLSHPRRRTRQGEGPPRHQRAHTVSGCPPASAAAPRSPPSGRPRARSGRSAAAARP